MQNPYEAATKTERTIWEPRRLNCPPKSWDNCKMPAQAIDCHFEIQAVKDVRSRKDFFQMPQ